MNQTVGYLFVLFLSIFAIQSRANNVLTENFITSAGFPVETHHVTTEDGYFLTLHRIPSTNCSSSPVLLIHPMSSSGLIWVLSLVPGLKPIAYSLSNKGHDVWILHHRGTTESFGHRTLKTSSSSYWNFTLHELGVFDIANSVDYIRQKTNRKQINCIGMSQGASTLLMLLTSRPKFNRKISAAYMIAPVFECKYIPVTVVYGADLIDLVLKIVKSNGKFYVELGDSKLRENFSLLANNEIIIKLFLQGASLSIGSFHQDTDYNTFVKNAIKFLGDNMCIRVIEHYNQIFRNHKFSKFDYGERENMKKYKQKWPPTYDVTTIDIPISIASFTSDIVGTPKDCRSLKKMVKKSRIRYFNGNHWDLWASPATTNKIVDDFEEFIESTKKNYH